MKKTYSIVVCILLLCSVLLIVNVGTTKASESGYTLDEYYMGTAPTVDGKWTTTDEWHDSVTMRISANALWQYKLYYTTDYYMCWLIEFADNTNDAGDRWQICLDTLNDGGNAPNTNDYKWEIEGHTTLKEYVGTGTGWTTIATKGAVTWKDSIDTSPNDPAPHYILEFILDKTLYTDWGANQPPFGIRVACYDASNDAAGWQAWPPTSADDPSRWGLIETITGTIPEGLTIGVMLALSTVAVVVSIRYFRKPPKL